MDDEWFQDKLLELELACNGESDRIRELVSEVVPTYRYRSESGAENAVSQ